MIETVEYGPFTDGYVASKDRTVAGRNAITDDSRDCGIDPQTFAIVSRPGSATRFDAAGALVGLLEAKWQARVRQFLLFESDSFQDGQPNLGGLFTDEVDKEGQFYFRSSNGAGSNQVIGKSYGTVHRSQANVTPWNFLMIPFVTEHATDKWTRCKSIAQRKVVCSGARKVLRVGKGMLSPNKQGTPIWYNGKFNDSSASGTEKEFVRPLGPIGPIFPIRRTAVPAPATGTWLGADTAYWGYCYQFENGEFSAVHIPDVPITVDVGTPAGQYPYVTLIVPPGPPDCIARFIFRTTKWAVGTPADAVDPTVMLFSGVILNNYQTVYNDFGGDDDSLRDRPDIYRPDLFMPPRASSACTMDGRVVFFDLKINRAVIELAPYSADSVAVNLDTYMYSDAGAYGNPWFYWWCDGTNLKLKHNIGGVWAAAITDLTIALAGKTLLDVVNTINAVVPNVGVWTWRSKLLPGVDANEPATSLETTNAADYFDDDTKCNDGTTGNQRVICGQTLPGILFVNNTCVFANAGTDPRALHFTVANPAATGSSADAPITPNGWRGSFDCRRRLEGAMGRMVGGCTLLDGCLVLATNGIGILRNVRGGKTGVDSDYRLEVWKRGAGVIAWGAHGEGDGWGVYTERQGIMVNDGKREVCISGRVWNSKANNGNGMGPWAYEFSQCKKWVATNADDGSAQFHVSVGHGRIYVFFRSSASVTYPDMYQYYDYTAAQNRIGVDQVVMGYDSSGRPIPFPWSAPIRIRGSQLVVIPRSDGDHVYTAPDDLGAGHSTGDGACVEIELTSSNGDDGVQQAMTAYLQTDRFDDVRGKKRVSKVDCEYYDPNGALQLSGAIDFARSTSTAIGSALTAISDGTISGIARQRTPAALRGPANTFELKVTGSPTVRSEIRRAVVRFRRLNTTSPAL